jgi:membrane-associated protein
MLPNSPIVTWLLTYRYLIAYPLGIVEGPVVMMIAGFLVRLGVFAFWPIYLVLIAGDLTGDVIWYHVGRHGGRPLIEKYGHWFSITPENVERAESFFHEHQGKILFISKLTTGFGFAIATLIAAGAAHVPFKKYMTINLLGEFIWAGFLFAIGYAFGHLYTLVNKGLRWMFVGALIVILVLALFGFMKFMRKRFASRPPLL